MFDVCVFGFGSVEVVMGFFDKAFDGIVGVVISVVGGFFGGE